MKRALVLLVLMVAVHRASFSQGEFLLRGQSGYSGMCGFRTDSEKREVLLSAGYSYRGLVDVNLLYNKANSGSVQGCILSPSMTFYCLKQEDAEGVPTVGCTVGYSHYRTRTTATIIIPDTVAVKWCSYEKVSESSVNAILLGMTAQRRTGRWKVFFFQPLLGAGLSMAPTGSVFTLTGGLSIGTRIIQGPLIILTSRVERQAGLTCMVFNLGAIF